MHFEMPIKFEIKCVECDNTLFIISDKYESKHEDNIRLGAVENEGFISCRCGNYIEII